MIKSLFKFANRILIKFDSQIDYDLGKDVENFSSWIVKEVVNNN